MEFRVCANRSESSRMSSCAWMISRSDNPAQRRNCSRREPSQVVRLQSINGLFSSIRAVVERPHFLEALRYLGHVLHRL